MSVLKILSVLGATLVVVTNAQQCRLTAADQLGPFYLADQPVDDMVCAGDSEFPNQKKLYVRGRVLDEDCSTPLPNYRVEVWQADSDGNYNVEEHGCDRTMYSGDQGEYQFIALPPGQYTFGIVRPRHIHFMATPNGTCHSTLVTQGYFSRADKLGNESCRTSSHLGCNGVDSTNIFTNLDVFDKTLPKSIRKCAGVISLELNFVLRRGSTSCSFAAPNSVAWKNFKCPCESCPSKKQCKQIDATTANSSTANSEYCINVKILKKLSKCSYTARVLDVTAGHATLDDLEIKKKAKIKICLDRQDICFDKKKSYKMCGLFVDLTTKDITASSRSSIEEL